MIGLSRNSGNEAIVAKASRFIARLPRSSIRTCPSTMRVDPFEWKPT